VDGKRRLMCNGKRRWRELRCNGMEVMWSKKMMRRQKGGCVVLGKGVGT
jgi:hypothetical protein